MLEIRLKRNPEYCEEKTEEDPRYFLEVDLTFLHSGEGCPLIPVYWKRNPFPHPLMKEFYSTEVLGVRLEKGNLDALRISLENTLLGMVKYTSLPRYFLILGQGSRVIPAYPVDKKLQTTLSGGPQFQGRDITELWGRVREYLANSIGPAARGPLNVYTLSPSDLKLRPPLFVLSSPGEEGVRIPFFGYPERGEAVLHYDGLSFPANDQGNVFILRKELAQYLAGKGRIASPCDLRIEDMEETTCLELKRVMRPANLSFSCLGAGGKMQVPVYTVEGDFVAALRQGGTAYTLCFGQDPQDLAERVGRELEEMEAIPESQHFK